MHKVNIILTESTLSITKFNSITSQLYVEVGTVSFPSKGWFDLSGSVLSMWLLSVNSYIQNNDHEATLYFMDGDYSMKLECLKKNQSLLRLIDSNNEVFVGIIDMFHFGNQLLTAVDKVIRHFGEQSNLKIVHELMDLSSALSLSLHNMD